MFIDNKSDVDVVLSANEGQPKLLSVFDFDGTLTRHDSFIPFLRFAFGHRIFIRKIIKMALPGIRCMRRKLTRDELKEVLIKTFLTGVE